MTEEAAKAAWLAKLDTPTFSAPPAKSEEAAKAAWLNKFDDPSWFSAAPAQPSPVESTVAVAVAAGAASETPVSTWAAAQDAAKKAWLNAPTGSGQVY